MIKTYNIVELPACTLLLMACCSAYIANNAKTNDKHISYVDASEYNYDKYLHISTIANINKEQHVTAIVTHHENDLSKNGTDWSEEDNDDETERDSSEERDMTDAEDTVLTRIDSFNDSRNQDTMIYMYNSFVNRKTFSCPKIKADFITGTDTSDLSPEDISVIAAMGDSLATGKGLWPKTDIEFRGASFPIGGDASIDGLVTTANILLEFNEDLIGVSHGMGTRDDLPDHQLNVGEADASTTNMPEQAKELMRRLQLLKKVDLDKVWTMVIIAIGTTEICGSCDRPNLEALLEALKILNEGIRKAFVVLLGPVHVSSAYQPDSNLLMLRCECSMNQSAKFVTDLNAMWRDAFIKLQNYFEQPGIKRKEFGFLALPMLTITSRHPQSLFIPNQPLLSRKGHSYATKWLWNRLITGPAYNLSRAILSEDAYYCPAMGCPYFRTQTNRHYCRLVRHIDANRTDDDSLLIKSRKRSTRSLYLTAVIVILICFCSVLIIGTLIYQRSRYESRGRYEMQRNDKTSSISYEHRGDDLLKSVKAV